MGLDAGSPRWDRGVGLGAWLLADAYIYGIDITLLAVPVVAVFLMIAPGLLLLACLVTPGARRAIWTGASRRRVGRISFPSPPGP